ncbi:hypothetical protein KGF57_004752 [Candida theae]|uniref:Uncharacterized protein n=1 Tax=Candida theae TaxID=1198502 RepID=A0AAD5BAV8_9ASCO|nr:uncharacterized protein KGF57_004752 [Candida theae]KAI5949154.1 hypothetical protein KGF57_004752 [Candida theae]
MSASVPGDLLGQIALTIEEAFASARNEDQETIAKLEKENTALKETIRLQEEELKKMRSIQGDARSNQFPSPKKDPLVQSSSQSSQGAQKVNGKDLNTNSTALDNIYLYPTQYSDTDEESNAIDKTSSPVKMSCSRQTNSNSNSNSTCKPSISTYVQLKNEQVRASNQLRPAIHTNKPNSPIGSPPRKKSRCRSTEFEKDEGVDENTPPTSQAKTNNKEENLEQIADSQDEDDTILSQVAIGPRQYLSVDIPQDLNPLQTRMFLSNYYANLLKTDPDFKIHLVFNPIKQISWDFSDFKANKHYKPGNFTQLVNRNSLFEPKKFNQYKQFYSFGDNEGVSGQEFEDKLSQIFGKFESPPGFMESDFPNTQEMDERKRTVRERQLKRLARRIASCVMVEDGVQVGEYVFGSDVLNQYVILGRWYVD